MILFFTFRNCETLKFWTIFFYINDYQTLYFDYFYHFEQVMYMYYLLGHRLEVEKESFAQDKPAKIDDLFKSKVHKNANLCNVYRHYNIKQENKHIK